MLALRSADRARREMAPRSLRRSVARDRRSRARRLQLRDRRPEETGLLEEVVLMARPRTPARVTVAASVKADLAKIAKLDAALGRGGGPV